VQKERGVSYRGRARRWIVVASLLVEAGASLKSRRLQAALSAFGIATGIAAVVVLVALVSGLHRMALSTLNAVGANIMQVTIDTDPAAGDPNGLPLTLRPDDAAAVLRTSPFFDLATAENSASAVVRGSTVQATSVVQTSSGGLLRRTMARAMTAQIRGVTGSGFEMLGLTLATGRLPLSSEFDRAERVAVLGARIARQIYASREPVGQVLVLGNWPFRVVGVLEFIGEPEGEFRAFQDQVIYVPYGTVAAMFRGNDAAANLSLRLRDPGRAAEAVADARGILARRQMRLGQTSGQLRFTTTLERLREMNLVINGLKLLVGLVGGIGLFVGAVGVANVLLVSVRERTQEIGVRRAVGATRGDIFLGFLIESLAITLLGGLCGIAGAWLLTVVASWIPAIPDGAEPHISLVTAAVAITILVLVGLAAGVGPARRAAAVFPAEALRAE
jgi:putative ABC transport system permease protein